MPEIAELLENLNLEQTSDPLISRRLAHLESGRKKVVWDQRWPTEESIRRHFHRLSFNVPKIIITRSNSGRRWNDIWEHHVEYRTGRPETSGFQMADIFAPSRNDKADFPVPIHEGHMVKQTKNATEFPSFPELPTEIRIQIFKMEIRRPRVIEARYSRVTGTATFIGSSATWSPLLITCRESREIALREEYEYLVAWRGYGDRL